MIIISLMRYNFCAINTIFYFITMKKLLILLFIVSSPIIGQNNEDKKASKTFCEITIQKTQNELKNGTGTLLLIGGIAPIIYENDVKFQENFGIKFFDYGCTPPNYDCIVENNLLIFKYLDDKYGNQWRKEIRSDIIGFEKYNTNNKI